VDLNYTAEDQAYRQKVRAWLQENLPREPIETLEQRRAWHRKLYDAGMIGMGWPKAYGGQDARPMEQAIVGEEMARANAPAGVGGLGISIVGPTIIKPASSRRS
jgi:alkylation response protein AidB-like acyl-CoA dehydrogenase